MTINIFIWQDGGWRLDATVYNLNAMADYLMRLPAPWRVESYATGRCA